MPRTGTVAADAVLKRTFIAVGPQVEPVGRVEPFLITTSYGEIIFSVTAALCCLRRSFASPRIRCLATSMHRNKVTYYPIVLCSVTVYCTLY